MQVREQITFTVITVNPFEAAPREQKKCLAFRGKASKRKKVDSQHRVKRFNEKTDTSANISYLKMLKKRGYTERKNYYKTLYGIK